MKIIVADFYRSDKEHFIYNASLFKICTLLPKVEHVCFNADSRQIDAIKTMNEFEHSVVPIAMKSVKVPIELGRGKWIRKIFFEASRAISLLITSPKDTVIFFASLSPISSFIFKVFKFFFKRGRKVIITLHGDVDFIQQNKTTFRNWLGKFFIWSFSVKNKNTKYLALSFPIRTNLINTGYFKKDELFWINHPYLFKKKSESSSSKKHVIEIGHIGLASREKNAEMLFRLANEMSVYIEAEKVKFSIVGMLANINEFMNDNVECYAEAGKMLDKKLFNEKLSKLDYAIFFYSDNNYKFCSSGAVLDAIDHEIPIIALKSEGFEYIFSDAGAPIGFLCSTYHEMKEIITEIVQGKISVEDYQAMRNNLSLYKKHYTVDYVADQFLKNENLLNFFYA